MTYPLIGALLSTCDLDLRNNQGDSLSSLASLTYHSVNSAIELRVMRPLDDPSFDAIKYVGKSVTQFAQGALLRTIEFEVATRGPIEFDTRDGHTIAYDVVVLRGVRIHSATEARR